MTIGIGLLGLGTVGAGVAGILTSPEGRHPLVADLALKRVAVRDLNRPRPVELPESILCTDPETDVHNCGLCGNDCTLRAGVDGSRVRCAAGRCVFTDA